MKKWILLPILAFILIGADSIKDARKANQAYRSENYKKAEKLYRNAIQQNPENLKLQFNLANTLTKQGEFKEAANIYQRFVDQSKKPGMKARAEYNMGNVYAQMKKWDKAAEHYRKALKYDPDDIQAKHNYELAKRKERQQKKRNQQKNQNKNQNKNNKKQNKQNQKNQQDNKQQQNKKQQNQQDQNKQDQQQQQDSQKQDRDKSQQNQSPRKNQQKKRMSKKEAQKILQALENDEKQLLKQLRQQKGKPNSSNAKDW